MFQPVFDAFAKSKLLVILVWAGFLYLAFHPASSNARTTNFSSKFILIAVIVIILGYGFSLMFEPWFKLSEVFATELTPPEIFFERQSCLLGETHMKGAFQVGSTRIKGYLNIGITEQKLYLSQTEPLSFILKPLSIEIKTITKIETCVDALMGECYKFFIGEPTITTLVLSKELIEKLEREYGEPIFSSKLAESN